MVFQNVQCYCETIDLDLILYRLVNLTLFCSRELYSYILLPGHPPDACHWDLVKTLIVFVAGRLPGALWFPLCVFTALYTLPPEWGRTCDWLLVEYGNDDGMALPWLHYDISDCLASRLAVALHCLFLAGFEEVSCHEFFGLKGTAAADRCASGKVDPPLVRPPNENPALVKSWWQRP